MANEYLDDYEQAEAVKKWIRDNGGAIVVGVVLALGGLFGWRYWQDYQAEQQQLAARSYADLVSAIATSEPQLETLEAFQAAHGGSAYPGFAALALAARAVETGQLEAAASFLRRAAEIAEPEPLRQVAGLRLARVLAAQGDFDAALAAAASHGTGAFAALGAEVRGDILALQGDADGAREAYETALGSLDAGSDRNLLQMKIDDLAGAGGENGSS